MLACTFPSNAWTSSKRIASSKAPIRRWTNSVALSRSPAIPARIEMLSRFRSAAEQKKVLADLEAGKVDVVIGTHRLLSKDVKFADLGLLIVDEEQRFGVAHKERLKEMRKNVDALALSATPIP